jgi:cobalt-zinc-cadmium efflux system outer membrane protein
LTLDQAVYFLERENLTLAALRMEGPQARADVLTAGQRPNSFLFVVGGKDGPVRLRPLDVPPKRWARALIARLAARVTEAQYRDAVRTQTANLYTAYVGAQEAQLEARFARAYLTGLERLTEVTKQLVERGQGGNIDLGRMAAVQDRAAATATEAEVALGKARLTLADLLNVPDAGAERLEVREETEEREPALPALGELTRLALSHRPDLRAYRVGFRRAQAEWLRAWVERWPDLYLLSQPNRPGRPDGGAGADAVPRASGLVVSLPDSGHDRGRVARARINVAKSGIELARAERQVVLEVRQAHLEYEQSLAIRRRLKEDVLPSARQVRDDALRLFQGGEVDARAYLGAQSEYNEVVHQSLKAAIRHRRGALALNTAVGSRVVP